jgi:hypothetical protein
MKLLIDRLLIDGAVDWWSVDRQGRRLTEPLIGGVAD